MKDTSFEVWIEVHVRAFFKQTIGFFFYTYCSSCRAGLGLGAEIMYSQSNFSPQDTYYSVDISCFLCFFQPLCCFLVLQKGWVFRSKKKKSWAVLVVKLVHILYEFFVSVVKWLCHINNFLNWNKKPGIQVKNTCPWALVQAIAILLQILYNYPKKANFAYSQMMGC